MYYTLLWKCRFCEKVFSSSKVWQDGDELKRRFNAMLFVGKPNDILMPHKCSETKRGVADLIGMQETKVTP